MLLIGASADTECERICCLQQRRDQILCQKCHYVNNKTPALPGVSTAGVPGLEPRTNDSHLGRATPPQLGRNPAYFRGFHASSVRAGTDSYGLILVTTMGIWFVSGHSTDGAAPGAVTRRAGMRGCVDDSLGKCSVDGSLDVFGPLQEDLFVVDEDCGGAFHAEFAAGGEV